MTSLGYTNHWLGALDHIAYDNVTAQGFRAYRVMGANKAYFSNPQAGRRVSESVWTMRLQLVIGLLKKGYDVYSDGV